MGRRAWRAVWRGACTVALAAWTVMGGKVQAVAQAPSLSPVPYSPVAASSAPASLYLPGDLASLALAAPARGEADASASTRVAIRIPAALRLSVRADEAAPVTARAARQAAGPQAVEGGRALSASVAARIRTSGAPKPVEVQIFANTPWALFVRLGEGPAAGVQLSVLGMRPAVGPGSAVPGAPGFGEFTLNPQGPGKLVVRSHQPGVTVLRLQVTEAPAFPVRTQRPAASEVELGFHLVTLT